LTDSRFYCSCLTLHLPPVPTRRSSDLFDSPHPLQSADDDSLPGQTARDPGTSGPSRREGCSTDRRDRDRQPGERLRSSSAGNDQIGKHTSELQSRENLVCRLLLEKKKK